MILSNRDRFLQKVTMKTSFWDHSGKPSVFVVKENGKEIYRGGFEEGYKLINMSIEQDITRLTQEWYALMGEDHHKDRERAQHRAGPPRVHWTSGCRRDRQ
jgi:hypothetical protein